MTNTTTAPRKNIKTIIALAACFLLVFGLFGTTYYSKNLKVDSVVDIDVNPSIEISTNKKEKVIKVEAVNLDAEKIIDGMDLKGVDLDVAINALIGSLVKNGYLVSDAENNILVSVVNDDEAKAIHTRNLVISDISDALKANGTDADIVNQTVKETTDAKTFAEESNISLGKATLILNLCSKDSSLDKSALAKMSLHDIAAIISKNNIDISDIVDYEADDSVWENVKDSVEEVNENEAEATTTAQKSNNTTTASSDKITADKAKEIALSKAGLKASEVKGLKAEYDYDDGVAKYEVEFKANGYEYDYEINAKTGAIIKSEKEKDDDVVTTKKVTTTAASSASISASEAKSIALKHAGFSASEVSFMKCELDTEDNGQKEYEVEFRNGIYEYSYTIDPSSGKILDYEKEIDD